MKRHVLYNRIEKIMRSDSYLKYGKESLRTFYEETENELVSLIEYDIKFASYLTNLYQKYDVFYKTLTQKEYNKNYELAIKLQNVISGGFDLTDLDSVEFKIIKDYYENEYRYYISFRPDEVERLDDIFYVLSRTREYKNAINFNCSTEANNYLRKVVEQKKKLTPEEVGYVEKYAVELNAPDVNAAILKLYTEIYHVGESMHFDKKELIKELDKLVNFITSSDFEETFGRKYDIVDMYLTTNLQVIDVIDINASNYDINKLKVIKHWMSDQFSLICRTGNNGTSRNQKLALINYPATHQIAHFKKLDYKMYADKKYNKEDVEKAEEILLDLNRLYGVKYDILSLSHIVNSYKENNDLSYYDVADEYYDEVISNTYVDLNKDNPTFTRRYKK